MTEQREDFETTASRMGYSLIMRKAESEDGEYLVPATQDAWDMWQERCGHKSLNTTGR